MRIQRSDVKKVLCLVHNMNLGGNVVVLDGEKSYAQNRLTGRRAGKRGSTTRRASVGAGEGGRTRS